jgi:hypothetical protein
MFAVTKPFFLGLALSFAAAVVWATRYRARRTEDTLHRNELQTWEGEGGNPAPSELPRDR